MRILHISHSGLPDIRIEKTAMTMKKLGHEMVFLGGRSVEGQYLDAFDETHSMRLANSLRVVFDPTVKRHWLKRIREIKPDVVQAHNCIVGHFLLSSDHNAIFNEHEYLSKQSTRYDVRPFVRRMAVKPMRMMFPKWERKLVERFPTLTTHRNMTTEYQRFGDYVATVSNVPLRVQVKGLSEPTERKGIVYVGSDFNLARFLPHRNLEGLKDVIEFDVLTGLSHGEMMEKLMTYEVGLTAWHPHPWHLYSDANKNYDYLHAGLPVITNHIIKEALFPDNMYVFGFAHYSDIPDILEEMPDFDRNVIRKYAMKHYIWENFEGAIREAYRRA